ncbi:hypothetical protein [Sphingobacterium hungaricum]|uniref:DUF5666 domain-containing protein n=1 Tax=Sphingobacterium hungaricum TaxID=2082723 RepID=A0A928YS12_9SPHI|nr:hypothetical protein [Sphingobacterium hungaricum]MBE8715242.1 hypothetical protein [Sphingobacterium hungaricum]
MKNLKYILCASLLLFICYSCSTTKKTSDAVDSKDSIQTVTGRITNIENGKDGYMATLVTSEGKTYIATISIVNMQKFNGTFKRHEVGETITVVGEGFQNDAKENYILVHQLNP